MSKSVEIFIAYSRKDAEYLDELKTHLAPLERSEKITIWYDGKIEPGATWEPEIKKRLHSADIVLLLVSASSIASDYFYDIEMREALERHDKGVTKVVPFILRPCAWTETTLAKLQVIPKDGKAATTWNDRDEAYSDGVVRLSKLVKSIAEQRLEKIGSKKKEEKEEKEHEEDRKRAEAKTKKNAEEEQNRAEEVALKKEAMKEQKHAEETKKKAKEMAINENENFDSHIDNQLKKSPFTVHKFTKVVLFLAPLLAILTGISFIKDDANALSTLFVPIGVLVIVSCFIAYKTNSYFECVILPLLYGLINIIVLGMNAEENHLGSEAFLLLPLFYLPIPLPGIVIVFIKRRHLKKR